MNSRQRSDEVAMDSEDERDFRLLEEDYLRSASAGKPKIGCLCLRVPPETIEACGAVPIRIIPRPGYDPSGFTPIRTDGCSFCRSVPAILKTEYCQNLSAIVAGACCDQMRRLADVLASESDIPVIFFGAPRTWNADRDYFRGEMSKALRRVEGIAGRRATDSNLWNRIRARNDLKRRVDRLRQEEKLPNALLSRIAGTLLPPEKVVSFLSRYENRPPMSVTIRLLLAGSIPGVWELNVMEANGARFVADATCLGDRVFYHLTCEEGDPVQQLYETYVENNLCPHRRPVTPLIEYVRELSIQKRVDGIVYRSVKFCHPWGLLAERMKKELPVPFLRVDDDLTSPAVENLRTRVGAFIEMSKMRRARSA